MNKVSVDLSVLNSPFRLSEEQIQFFRENRYIKLKEVFPADILAYFGQTIADKVRELNTMHLPMEERDTYSKAFLQIMNLWREDEDIKQFVFGKRLAKIATDLMGVSGVRLYHDQALFKEPGGGITPWHADQYYWPLANEHTVTVWIPLQATPLEMGPLEFSSKSHQLREGRDLKISDDSEMVIDEILANAHFEHIIEAFDLGEVSFHAGWLYHRAGANKSDQMRQVMTIIYMDQDIRLKAPSNENQQADWDTWCPGAQIGEIVNTPLNPVLYSKE
ncbi:MAG: phytanoyl-CoA dioxygenase family protein [Saprospiraceae bacterium]